ncbi:MAG: cupin domain-containing protein [Pyrobaculum sp.]
MSWTWERLGCLESRFIHGANLTVAQFRLRAGCVVDRHSHTQEQITVVIEGVLEFDVGGRIFTATPGDVVYIPPGVEHSVKAITEAFVVDSFSPPRDDWR